jgi:hypothetical protein
MPWASPNRHAALQQGSLGVFDFSKSLIGNGLQALYRLDAGQYNGVPLDNLTTINDQSGNGFTATSASGHEAVLDPPGNSFPGAAAFFYGSNWMGIAAGLATAMNATDFSVWWIGAQGDDVSVSQAMISIGTAAGYSLDLEASSWSLRSYGVGVAPDGTADDAAVHLVLVYRTGGVVHMEVDGVAKTVTSNNIGVNAPSGISQLGQLVGGAFPLIGWILEAAAVSRALTSTERAALAAYAPVWHKY